MAELSAYHDKQPCRNCGGSGEADRGHYAPGVCSRCGGTGEEPSNPRTPFSDMEANEPSAARRKADAMIASIRGAQDFPDDAGETCEVCGTDRTGRDNGPIYRRTLTHKGRTVVYCADVVGCGEAGAMEFIENAASDLRAERVQDIRGELSPAIGFLRLHMRDAGIAEVEGPYEPGEHILTSVLRNLWAALDRADRVVVGEDYREQQAAFDREHPGVAHWSDVPECCLPRDVRDG